MAFARVLDTTLAWGARAVVSNLSLVDRTPQKNPHGTCRPEVVKHEHACVHWRPDRNVETIHETITSTVHLDQIFSSQCLPDSDIQHSVPWSEQSQSPIPCFHFASWPQPSHPNPTWATGLRHPNTAWAIGRRHPNQTWDIGRRHPNQTWAIGPSTPSCASRLSSAVLHVQCKELGLLLGRPHNLLVLIA